MPFVVEYSCDVKEFGTVIIDEDGIDDVDMATDEAIQQIMDIYEDQCYNISIEIVKEIKKEEINNYGR